MRAVVLAFFVVAAFAAAAVALEHEDEPIEFALRFRTQAYGGLNHGIAMSQSLISEVRDGSPWFTFMEVADGVKARWTSVLVAQTNTTWSEKGNVTFDESGNNSFTFASPGMAGHALAPNWGGIVYNITGGTGKFEKCKGVMVDTFWNPSANSTIFFINAWAMIWPALK
jgi:hypothetical protein